jgi:hypothetical protein
MREDGFMRVLVFNEDGFSVAQGLDVNIRPALRAMISTA